ncbi:helix-turn-helix domain-containing protein [Pseudomonas fulva]|uniref:helix-turn-helix domain-containing protein n=1 Tax=Pseudomonas fulva TaxID=47880 RepID=UPI00201E0C22|nr:helix-turn-helix domain-containing protein [Pseudomonas fulva]UQY33570.1 helix-turn-helix domain-containing protein [Pseudomonas fulva]
MSAIADAVTAAGGPVSAAKACGISRQAVDKWLANECLPRTDYTGETNYAQVLAHAAEQRGEGFAVEWLRDNARPKPRAA